MPQLSAPSTDHSTRLRVDPLLWSDLHPAVRAAAAAVAAVASPSHLQRVLPGASAVVLRPSLVGDHGGRPR